MRILVHIDKLSVVPLPALAHVLVLAGGYIPADRTHAPLEIVLLQLDYALFLRRWIGPRLAAVAAGAPVAYCLIASGMRLRVHCRIGDVGSFRIAQAHVFMRAGVLLPAVRTDAVDVGVPLLVCKITLRILRHRLAAILTDDARFAVQLQRVHFSIAGDGLAVHGFVACLCVPVRALHATGGTRAVFVGVRLGGRAGDVFVIDLFGENTIADRAHLLFGDAHAGYMGGRVHGPPPLPFHSALRCLRMLTVDLRQFPILVGHAHVTAFPTRSLPDHIGGVVRFDLLKCLGAQIIPHGFSTIVAHLVPNARSGDLVGLGVNGGACIVLIEIEHPAFAGIGMLAALSDVAAVHTCIAVPAVGLRLGEGLRRGAFIAPLFKTAQALGIGATDIGLGVILRVLLGVGRLADHLIVRLLLVMRTHCCRPTPCADALRESMDHSMFIDGFPNRVAQLHAAVRTGSADHRVLSVLTEPIVDRVPVGLVQIFQNLRLGVGVRAGILRAAEGAQTVLAKRMFLGDCIGDGCVGRILVYDLLAEAVCAHRLLGDVGRGDVGVGPLHGHIAVLAGERAHIGVFVIAGIDGQLPVHGADGIIAVAAAQPVAVKLKIVFFGQIRELRGFRIVVDDFSAVLAELKPVELGAERVGGGRDFDILARRSQFPHALPVGMGAGAGVVAAPRTDQAFRPIGKLMLFHLLHMPRPERIVRPFLAAARTGVIGRCFENGAVRARVDLLVCRFARGAIGRHLDVVRTDALFATVAALAVYKFVSLVVVFWSGFLALVALEAALRALLPDRRIPIIAMLPAVEGDIFSPAGRVIPLFLKDMLAGSHFLVRQIRRGLRVALSDGDAG